MIKKTLYFGNPAYLSLRDNQLVVRMPLPNKTEVPQDLKEKLVRTIPIEDIGVVVIDDSQITITSSLLASLLENNVAVVSCNQSKMPVGLFMPLAGNTVQHERFALQTESSLPLRKQLWAQTIQQKIRNQASLLMVTSGYHCKNMFKMADDVKSGDSDNKEGQAAAFYWKNIFGDRFPGFIRNREGCQPNPLLNYGYAILRAVIARALMSSGLLPTFGLHHHNRYNAYCLADDVMEPYRPYVDQLVLDIVATGELTEGEITKEQKVRLLGIPALDVVIDGKKSPLLVAASTTTASLVKCFAGEIRKISYPVMEFDV